MVMVLEHDTGGAGVGAAGVDELPQPAHTLIDVANRRVPIHVFGVAIF